MSVPGVLLISYLIFTPGPLDRYGGHLDVTNGDYHVHAGGSYQFRYVDATGRIWEGQGPRPEENLRFYGEDVLWSTPFVPIVVGTVFAAMIIGYKADIWLQRRRYRHAIRHRMSEVQMTREEAARKYIVRPYVRWQGSERRGHDRRARERRAGDRRAA